MWCNGCKSNQKETFDAGILNDMVDRSVCREGVSLCKKCIVKYYGKTYEEIRSLEA